FRLHWFMWIRVWVVIVLGIIAVSALSMAQIPWAPRAGGVLALLVAGHQSFWGRIFGYGNVEITGRGETAMVLDRIAHPVEVKREIESAYSAHIETQHPGTAA